MFSTGRGRNTRSQVREEALSLGRKHRPDYWIIIICALLLAVGIIVVYAIGPALKITTNLSASYYTSRQIIAVVLSAVAFIFTATIPIQKWKENTKWILWIAIIATGLAVVLPVNPAYPAHRWVRLGSVSFQSVELLKFGAVLWITAFLTKAVKNNTITDFKKTFKPLLVLIIISGVIIAGIQSDLGSMAVLLAMLGVMAFVAGLPIKKIMTIIGVVIIGLIIAIIIFPYRIARIEAYLHPSSSNNCQNASDYQACQALIAVGSGGMFGLGLGHSVQAYGYEPEAANDSIFAIYAETFGFIGSIILVGLFWILFNRFKIIAENLDDVYSKLLVIGVLTWLSVQTIINIGAMIGLLPLKGITLPFVSYGGTSIVFSAAAVGLVFQLSRYTNYQGNNIKSGKDRRISGENNLNGRRFGRTYNSDSGDSL